jgi:Family of unknown function (DUF6493)
MSLTQELTQAVRANDAARIRDLVVDASEKERRSAAGEMERLLISRDGSRSVAPLAFLGTATARNVASWGWAASEAAVDDVVTDVLSARGQAFIQTLVRALEREDVQLWRLIRVAVRAGIVERPEDEGWIRGMIRGVAAWDARGLDSVYLGLVADSELLDDEVWRIFEVDCGSELRWAVTYEHVNDADGQRFRLERGDNLWTYALRRLAAEGRLDRERLLDASLDALMRDFRGTTIGWYVHFHDDLEPTRDEREARLAHYLMLLANPTPVVVRLGLTALKAVEDVVPALELARAASAPLTHRQKNLAVATLSLLEHAAARDAKARPALLEAAAQALAHERADVQERALKLLEQYQDEPESTAAARAVVLGLADAVAPTLHERVGALTGFAPELERTPAAGTAPRHAAEPRRERLTLVEALQTRPELEPVTSVDELVELGAALLAAQGNGDDAERFLDGVSRLCGERTPERLTAGLVKQAREATAAYYGLGGWNLIGTVVKAWAAGERPPKRSYRGSAIAFLLDRVNEVALRVARRQPRPLLAFPTHSGGWLDPDVLTEREQGFGRFRNRPDPADRAQAHLRATTLSPPRLVPAIERRKRWQFSEAEPRLVLRAESDLSELGPLEQAALALDHGSDDRYWWAAPPAWGGFDRLGVEWCLTVVPSLPELAFAGAAGSLVTVIEGASGYNHPEVVFQHALDPAVPLEPIAWLAVATASLGKKEDVRRPALDLIIESIEDGRFDAGELGRAVVWLLDERLGKLPRLVPTLRDASRVSPAHAEAVVATIDALLGAVETTPNGLHALLELAAELAAATGARIESPKARKTLERIDGEVSKSAKVGRLARDLLEA